MTYLNDTTLTAFCIVVMIASNVGHWIAGRPLTTPANILLSWIGLFFGLSPYFELYHYYKGDNYYWAIAAGVGGLIVGAMIIPRVSFRTVQAASVMLSKRWERRLWISLFMVVAYYIMFAIANVVRSGSMRITDLYLFDPYVGTDMSDWWLRTVKLTRPIAEAALVLVVGNIVWCRARGYLLATLGVCVVFVVANLTSYGGRQGVILLPVVVALLSCWRWPRLEKVILAVSISVALPSVAVLQLVRHQRIAPGHAVTVTGIIESTGSGGEWNSVGTMADLVHYADSRPVTYKERVQLVGVEVINWATNWIPRALWPGKPGDTSFSPRMTMALYGDRMSFETWVRTFTFIGQGYYLFGIPGAAAMGLAYGLSLLALLSFMRQGHQYYGTCAALIYKALIASRNDFGSWLFQALSLVVLSLVIWRFMRMGLESNVDASIEVRTWDSTRWHKKSARAQ